MNSSRRWLVIFTIVICVLAIVAISLVLTTKENQVVLLPQDTPQGTVQRYLIAIQERNFQKAYSYLSFSPTDKITTYSDWILMVSSTTQSAWKATLGKVTLNGNDAAVDVIIDTFHAGESFAGQIRSQQITFQLSKNDQKWLITSPNYIYWIF